MTKRIVYPAPLSTGDTIAVVAPSSGVHERLHYALDQAQVNLEQAGFQVIEGNVRTDRKLVSATAKERAEELERFMIDPDAKLVFPVWGGELLMEILPLLDWERLKAAGPKWVLGYSDVSTFLLSYTLLTGYASAHGTNYVDLSGLEWDSTTKQGWAVLSVEEGQAVEQVSSTHYQSEWHPNKLDGFNLDTPTVWKCLGRESEPEATVAFRGRLLGGCLETIFALIGTGFAPVREFVEAYCLEEGVVWYFESTDSNPADMYRKLWMMKMNGWFERCNGVLFGRPDHCTELDDFEVRDALQGIFGEMGIPVVYDADIGHVPPQVTLVNGAVVKGEVWGGKGRVVQEFR